MLNTLLLPLASITNTCSTIVSKLNAPASKVGTLAQVFSKTGIQILLQTYSLSEPTLTVDQTNEIIHEDNFSFNVNNG